MEGDTRLYNRNAPLRYFYPRPPGGGRHSYLGPIGAGVGISIHALRVEGDDSMDGSLTLDAFLSTPSGWRATICLILAGSITTISIHALRVEGDEDYAGNFGQAMISIHALRVEGDRDHIGRIRCAV